jgi:DNA primase
MERDESLVIDLLEGLLGEPRKHNDVTGQISFDCPVCSHDIKGLDEGDGKGNLEINYNQHVYKCWACAETHGTHGHLGRLIDQYGNKKDKQFYTLVRPDDFERKQKEYEVLRLPKEYQKFEDVNPKYPPRAQAYNYLKRRGITDEMIEKYDIGFALSGEYAGRIIVPSYDHEGFLNYFVSRSWDKYSKFKYKNPVAPKELLIFNESRINWDEDIYLVEGVFDGFFVPNSIPLLGKFLSDMLWETLYGKAKGRIIICLDGDAWEDAKKIYFKLSGGKLKGRIDIVRLPDDKDLGDLRGQIPEENYVVLEK